MVGTSLPLKGKPSAVAAVLPPSLCVTVRVSEWEVPLEEEEEEEEVEEEDDEEESIKRSPAFLVECVNTRAGVVEEEEEEDDGTLEGSPGKSKRVGVCRRCGRRR